MYASCMYLDNSVEKIAFVALDLVKYSKSLVRKARARIEGACGIPGKNVMISCTHTHSGPLISPIINIDGIKKGEEPDYGYLNEVEDKIVEVVREAVASSFTAKIGVEKGSCGKEQGVGGNRRDPNGLADPEVWVIGIQDSECRWRGCAVKYALHPTLIHGESKVVSADYPCYLRRYLSEIKPGITTLFLQGTSGNQSSRYFRKGQTFSEAKRIGETIAAEANRVMDNMTLAENAELVVQSVEKTIDIREIPPLDKAERAIESARRKLEGLRENKAPYTDIRTAEVNLLGAENQYGYALVRSKKQKIAAVEDELPVEVQVIGIGDGRIVGVQGELFVEYGLLMQSRSPFDKTFVVELANGALPGYLCTREAYREGGYEAGTSLLTGNSGDEIAAAAAELLAKNACSQKPR